MGAVMFGTDETIDCLVDVELKGSSNEPLCLAHKHSKVFFVAGVYLSDDGYVLRVKGADSFYPMPTGDELHGFQEAGMLPKELPPYEISWWDYGFGYSLWIVIGAMLLWYGVTYALARRSSHGSTADPPAA